MQALDAGQTALTTRFIIDCHRQGCNHTMTAIFQSHQAHHVLNAAGLDGRTIRAFTFAAIASVNALAAYCNKRPIVWIQKHFDDLCQLTLFTLSVGQAILTKKKAPLITAALILYGYASRRHWLSSSVNQKVNLLLNGTSFLSTAIHLVKGSWLARILTLIEVGFVFSHHLSRYLPIPSELQPEEPFDFADLRAVDIEEETLLINPNHLRWAPPVTPTSQADPNQLLTLYDRVNWAPYQVTLQKKLADDELWQKETNYQGDYVRTGLDLLLKKIAANPNSVMASRMKVVAEKILQGGQEELLFDLGIAGHYCDQGGHEVETLYRIVSGDTGHLNLNGQLERVLYRERENVFDSLFYLLNVPLRVFGRLHKGNDPHFYHFLRNGMGLWIGLYDVGVGAEDPLSGMNNAESLVVGRLLLGCVWLFRQLYTPERLVEAVAGAMDGDPGPQGARINRRIGYELLQKWAEHQNVLLGEVWDVETGLVRREFVVLFLLHMRVLKQ